MHVRNEQVDTYAYVSTKCQKETKSFIQLTYRPMELMGQVPSQENVNFSVRVHKYQIVSTKAKMDQWTRTNDPNTTKLQEDTWGNRYNKAVCSKYKKLPR